MVIDWDCCIVFYVDWWYVDFDWVIGECCGYVDGFVLVDVDWCVCVWCIFVVCDCVWLWLELGVWLGWLVGFCVCCVCLWFGVGVFFWVVYDVVGVVVLYG